MQEIFDPSNRAPDKPTDWIPISIALSIFVVAAITVLFFVEPPQPPTEPLKRGSGQTDTALGTDTPQDVRYQ